MPAIVLRMKFRQIRGSWNAEDLSGFMSRDFEPLQEAEFLRKLSSLVEKESLTRLQDKIFGAFRFGTSGDIIIGMIESFYPNCHEFWVCSPSLEKCIEGRRWIIKSTPRIIQMTLRKVVNDFVVLEGGDEIHRARMVLDYAIKNGLNAGLIVNFIILLLKSIYEGYSTYSFDFGLPILVFKIWFVFFLATCLYYSRKVAYIVKAS